MLKRPFFTVFFIFLSLASVACPVTDCGSYSCPRPRTGPFQRGDSPSRTRCCSSSLDSRSCCQPGGSACSDSGRDIRNYCPSPTHSKEYRFCCMTNNRPGCCQFPISIGALIGIVTAGFVLFIVTIFVVCCLWSKCPLAKHRRERQMQTGIGMQNIVAPYPGTGQIQNADAPRLGAYPLYPGDKQRQNQGAFYSGDEIQLSRWPQGYGNQ